MPLSKNMFFEIKSKSSTTSDISEYLSLWLSSPLEQMFFFFKKKWSFSTMNRDSTTDFARIEDYWYETIKLTSKLLTLMPDALWEKPSVLRAQRLCWLMGIFSCWYIMGPSVVYMNIYEDLSTTKKKKTDQEIHVAFEWVNWQ